MRSDHPDDIKPAAVQAIVVTPNPANLALPIPALGFDPPTPRPEAD